VHAAPPLTFPIRLTGVPASWHLSHGVLYRPYGPVLQATRWLTTGATNGHGGETYTSYTDGPATPHSRCPTFGASAHHHELINGSPVTVTTTSPSVQALCTLHADGLHVLIREAGIPPGLGVVSLFAHHLQLLGTNPANWARNPLG
jgi:hypothetical protein